MKPEGTIKKSSKSCYIIIKSKKSYCSCRTYEQAHYVRQELIKCNWDETQIPRILEEYPKYYTELLFFYQYINRINDNWIVTVPKSKSKNNKLEHIPHKKLETALYERDFLLEHDWDYDLLVETIDDTLNPYYSMELPPYPERKIRNIQKRTSHIEKIEKLIKVIKDDPNIHVNEIAKRCNVVPETIRNWISWFNMDVLEFKTAVLKEDNLLDKLQEKIYTPDLSPNKPANFKYYVSHNNRCKCHPYVIVNSDRKTFGYYPTRELAEKISKDLIACDWDKNRLPEIQKKYGFKPKSQKRNNIYKHGRRFMVQKQINKKVERFGSYASHEIAEKIRDELIACNWDKNQLQEIKTKVAKQYGGIIH